MSVEKPTLPEDGDELPEVPSKISEPRRGRYYMLDTDPGAEAALERSKRGIGREVIPIKANNNRKLECRICKGDHVLSRCPVIASTNISFDALRKMPVEARREYLKSLGLGQYFPDHSTRGSAVDHNKNATMKAEDAVDNGKTKAGGIDDMSAQSSCRGCAVENSLCLICEKSDHPTGACPYMLGIPRGAKVSSNADIFCECCNKVGAPHEDEERVKYYADLKFCGYCFAMGSHSAKSPEDCPNKEGQERLNKIHDETLKKLKKRAEEWRRRNPEAARINVT